METVAVLLSNVYLVHLEADPILNNNILLPLALIVQWKPLSLLELLIENFYFGFKINLNLPHCLWLLGGTMEQQL